MSIAIYRHMLKIITYLFLVPKVTIVEHIKGPADSHLPGERTADKVTKKERQPDLPKKTILR